MPLPLILVAVALGLGVGQLWHRHSTSSSSAGGEPQGAPAADQGDGGGVGGGGGGGEIPLDDLLRAIGLYRPDHASAPIYNAPTFAEQYSPGEAVGTPGGTFTTSPGWQTVPDPISGAPVHPIGGFTPSGGIRNDVNTYSPAPAGQVSAVGFSSSGKPALAKIQD